MSPKLKVSDKKEAYTIAIDRLEFLQDDWNLSVGQNRAYEWLRQKLIRAKERL